MSKKKKHLSHSLKILWLLLILCLLGLFFVFEASIVESYANFGYQYHYFFRQLQWFGIGIAIFVLGSLFPIKYLERLSPYIFLSSVILLLVVFIPSIGLEINGAKRWFSIFGFSIQPVEFFKVSLVVYFANWLSKHQRVLPLLFSTSFPVIILLLQPDFGSLLIILFMATGMFFIAGGSIKKLLPIVVVVVVFLTIAVFTSPYRLKRVKSFIDPNSDPLGASFQIRQITLALGSGGVFGRGLGNSQHKYAFIPEASSDSIFAIVAEEVGFVGSMVLLFLFSYYVFLLYRLSIVLKTNSFEQLLVTGLWLWVSGQTLLNLAAIVALVPLTGLTLPFFSQGGSSLVSLLFLNGIVYKLARTQN